MMEPLVSTPKRTGLGYLTEALGRHSTKGASGGAVMGSPDSPPNTSLDPNLESELTHSCTCKVHVFLLVILIKAGLTNTFNIDEH